MQHLLTISLLVSLLLSQQFGYAQDIKAKNNNTDISTDALGLKNTVWKSYIGGPVSDTMVLKYATDSSYFQSKKGATMVTSTFAVAGDTVVINDVSGRFACLNQSGKYHFMITGDWIKFDLIQDGCDGRANAMTSSKWQRIKQGASQ